MRVDIYEIIAKRLLLSALKLLYFLSSNVDAKK